MNMVGIIIHTILKSFMLNLHVCMHLFLTSVRSLPCSLWESLHCNWFISFFQICNDLKMTLLKEIIFGQIILDPLFLSGDTLQRLLIFHQTALDVILSKMVTKYGLLREQGLTIQLFKLTIFETLHLMVKYKDLWIPLIPRYLGS